MNDAAGYIFFKRNFRITHGIRAGGTTGLLIPMLALPLSTAMLFTHYNLATSVFLQKMNT